MAEPRPCSTPPKVGDGAHLPALTPAGRELLEVLWSAGRPLTTRKLLDAIARRFPHRAGRRIQTVSTLVAELMAQGWVAGEKRSGTRWVYRPAVSRGEGLGQIARWVVEDLVREPEDRRKRPVNRIYRQTPTPVTITGWWERRMRGCSSGEAPLGRRQRRAHGRRTGRGAGSRSRAADQPAAAAVASWA